MKLDQWPEICQARVPKSYCIFWIAMSVVDHVQQISEAVLIDIDQLEAL